MDTVLVPLARDAADATTGIGAVDASLDGLTDAMLANAIWTNIYQNLLVNQSYASNCTGSACHDPGAQHGISLSSQAAGYTSVRSQVVPGSPAASTLVQVLQSGSVGVVPLNWTIQGNNAD